MSGKAEIWHVDWGTRQDKRWLTRILIDGSASPVMQAPELFEPWHERLLTPDYLADMQIILGLDLPIGLPKHYAVRVGITDFPQFLSGAQGPDWIEFSTVCRSLTEVSLERPFFPYHLVDQTALHGLTPQQAWLKKLGLTKSAVYRLCDSETPHRESAASLFWTKGANQVGKAALGGWGEVIKPLMTLHGTALGIWPFDGDFAALCATKKLVIAETYPGEIYGWFECKPISKTRQAERLKVIPQLSDTIADLGIVMTPSARTALETGFGNDARGDDRFDSFVGALGLYAVHSGKRPAPVPGDPIFRTVEGWILGQALP